MSRSHNDVSFIVSAPDGRDVGTYRTWEEASGTALGIAASDGKAFIDCIVNSESGARWLGGDYAVWHYLDKPEYSVFDRIEIKVRKLGRQR